MPYSESSYAFEKGSTVRFVDWAVGSTPELYPALPDDAWRFVRLITPVYGKNVVAARDFVVVLIRENFTPVVEVWRRFFDVADDTTGPANLQAGEQQWSATQFMYPSFGIVGVGVLMPPRSQLRANVSAFAGTSFNLSIEMVETFDPRLLSLFI